MEARFIKGAHIADNLLGRIPLRFVSQRFNTRNLRQIIALPMLEVCNGHIIALNLPKELASDSIM